MNIVSDVCVKGLIKEAVWQSVGVGEMNRAGLKFI